jgi:hypothetical protein
MLDVLIHEHSIPLEVLGKSLDWLKVPQLTVVHLLLDLSSRKVALKVSSSLGLRCRNKSLPYRGCFLILGVRIGMYIEIRPERVGKEGDAINKPSFGTHIIVKGAMGDLARREVRAHVMA